MKATGIIVEYNPFHNGHLHHIKETKKQSNCDLLIAVMSGNYTQRGDIAIIDKFKRTRLALEHGVDIVIELPYPYATASADLFAYGAVRILHELGVSDIYFGSESNDIKSLEEIAMVIDTDAFDKLVKEYLALGHAYPYASTKAITALTNASTTILSNDILGIQYIRSIIQLKSEMKYHSIQRVNNNYKDKTLSDSGIASATSIRKAIFEKRDITIYVPKLTAQLIHPIHRWDDYYSYLQYQLIANANTLGAIHDMQEGFHHSILKNNRVYTTFDEFVSSLTSKRYTESKVKRLLCHTLTQFSKEDFQTMDTNYIRVLGLNKNKSHLFKQITKKCEWPIITNLNRSNHHLLATENRVDELYNLVHKEKIRKIPIFVTK